MVAASKEGYLAERIDEMIAEGEEKYPLTFDIEKVVLTDIFSTIKEG